MLKSYLAASMSKFYLVALIFAGAITVLWISWILWTVVGLVALAPMPSIPA
jgi:hypothetical protein